MILPTAAQETLGNLNERKVYDDVLLDDLLSARACGCSENCTCGCQDWAAELLGWSDGEAVGDDAGEDDEAMKAESGGRTERAYVRTRARETAFRRRTISVCPLPPERVAFRPITRAQ